jgi:hypothetical protein
MFLVRNSILKDKEYTWEDELQSKEKDNDV